MRDSQNNLIGDLNDNFIAKTSGSLSRFLTASFDENQTVYDLLPEIINKPPIITLDIAEASNPLIKPYVAVDYLRPRKASGFLYKTTDQVVQVVRGANLTLRIKAQQPNTLNVENGVPKLIAPTTGLTYVWERDNIVLTSTKDPEFNSAITINERELTITNIQPVYQGSYVCKVSNDVGTTYSETVEIEVFNPYIDSAFYTNLVQNPYGVDGMDQWNTVSNELVTKELKTNDKTSELLSPVAQNFDFTTDFFHPRPYQIDSRLPVAGSNLKNDLQNGGFYFTRDRYKYLKKGGLLIAKAYQDINLTDLEAYIKGGIYGVRGVRAVFGCYLGNALNFLPTTPLLPAEARSRPEFYDTSKPRISYENYSLAGPSWGPDASVYVTIEEYQNNTKLPSILQDGNISKDPLTLWDPWTVAMGRNGNKPYGVYTDSRATTLHAAREFYPDLLRRPAAGQYVQFNRAVLPQLNPKTTKLRITMVFETKHNAIFETDKRVLSTSDELYEVVSWQGGALVGSLDIDTTSMMGRILSLPSSFATGSGGAVEQKPLNTIMPFLGEPRILATGFNLVLLPVYLQQPQTTEQETNKILIQNNVPAQSITPPQILIK